MRQPVNYDRLLKAAGTSGRFQTYFVIFTGFCNLLSSLLVTGLPFLQEQPRLQCLNHHDQYIPCTQDFACSSNLSQFAHHDHLAPFRVSHSHLFHNFITDFQMECATPYHIGLIGSSFFLGFMIGSIVFAPLADLIGRKKVIILGAGIFFFTMLYMLFVASTVNGLYLGMFLIGFRTSANSQIVYVMITEYTDMKSRVYFCISCNVLESVMNLFNGFYYTAGGNYKILYYFGAILSLILVIWTYLWIPESPRYLKTKDQEKQALVDFRFIAKFNNRQAQFKQYLSSLSLTESPHFVQEIQNEEELPLKPGKHQHSYNFKSPKFIVSVLVTSLNWFVCVLTAYGLHFGIKYLNSSMNVTMNLLSISQILSAGLFAVVGTQFPRKTAYFWSGVLVIIGSLITQYLTYIHNGTLLVQWMISIGIFFTKLFNGVMFSLVYIVTSELYPTKIRGTMFGVANMLGRMGGLLAPMVIEFEKDYFLPVFAVAALLSLIGSSFLKETKGMELSD